MPERTKQPTVHSGMGRPLLALALSLLGLVMLAGTIVLPGSGPERPPPRSR